MDSTCSAVLVIDDDPTTRDATAHLLDREGFAVKVAANGADGVRYARQHRPAAILLDIVLPGMGGYETLESLKVDPVTRDIPIVVYNGRDLVPPRFVGAQRLLELLRRHVAGSFTRERSA